MSEIALHSDIYSPDFNEKGKAFDNPEKFTSGYWQRYHKNGITCGCNLRKYEERQSFKNHLKTAEGHLRWINSLKQKEEISDNDLVKLNHKLKKDKKKLEEDLEESQQENESLEEQLDDCTQENKNLKGELKEVKLKNKSLSEKLIKFRETKEDNIKEYKNSKKQQDNKIKELEEEIESLKLCIKKKE
jgi:hypothetical protein